MTASVVISKAIFDLFHGYLRENVFFFFYFIQQIFHSTNIHLLGGINVYQCLEIGVFCANVCEKRKPCYG